MDRRTFLAAVSASTLLPSSLTAEGAPVTGFVFDKAFLGPIKPASHPESPKRLQAIIDEMRNLGIDKKVKHLPITVRDSAHLSLIHTNAHIKAMLARKVVGDVSALAVSAVLSAVTAVSTGQVRNAFCAIRPPGHHARNTRREEGFCCFNNIALAARYAQRILGHHKILIIDWDYHHGNATEEAFYDDPSVLFFSTHNMRVYPGTGDPARRGKGAGEGYNINVHFGCGASDYDMFRAWEQHLLPAAEKFRPDFVLISAGFDSRIDDKLGCFKITDIGFHRLTRMAMEIAATHANGRLVSALEGGYNPPGVGLAACAHLLALLGESG